jgi:hypothetical protein
VNLIARGDLTVPGNNDHDFYVLPGYSEERIIMDGYVVNVEKAIVSAMILMEDGGPDEINPDTAVRGLENIGYELMQLTGGNREEFISLLRRRMSAEAEDERAASFLESVPFGIGMIEE